LDPVLVIASRARSGEAHPLRAVAEIIFCDGLVVVISPPTRENRFCELGHVPYP
jgi:hypothetical protein